MLLVFLFSVGLAVLAFGVREVHLQRRLRREGVRVQGTVVRYDRRSNDGSSSLFAVVGFADADGNHREVRRTSSGTRRWPIGRQVPVVHLPGKPSTARIDLSSERRSIAIVFTAVGGCFTLAPIVITAFGLGRR